jgi:tetratricopeptide (TPR) repeat protein
LHEIGDSIVAAIASEVEAFERNRAMLKPPDSLDAWEALHRGLWHMYRFNKADNERAQHFFEMAIRLDPTFSRAYAGLSFTYWQNAFQGWEERTHQIERAYATAGEGLMADDRDPAAYWAMGRALWLRGLQEQSLDHLNKAVDLSPNFAQAYYALSFVHAITGDPVLAASAADHSRRLSPYDPMLFAMLAVRAMALARQGRFEEAADWAVSSATRPNAHAHIQALAALILVLAGRLDEARAYLAAIRQTLPHYKLRDFLAAFHFMPDSETLFRRAAALLDMA